MVGLELEAFLFEPDGERGWAPTRTPGSYVYGTGSAVDPSGTIEGIRGTAHAMGISSGSARVLQYRALRRAALLGDGSDG